MKLWIDPSGHEIVAPTGHIPLAVELLPAKVIAPLKRAFEGEEFNEHVYEAMFQRGYLHGSIDGNTVLLQQPAVDGPAQLPVAQQDWIAGKRAQGMDVQFNGR